MRADLEELIAKSASQLYRRYRQYVQAEDIRQEMWVWALKSKRIDSLSPWQLTRRLYDAGVQYCRKEKAAATGYDTSDEVFYSTRIIREMLPYATMAEPVQSRGVNDANTGTARKGAAGTYGELETVVADMRKAFEGIAKTHQQVLLAYVDGSMTEGRAVARAIKAMQRKLGGRRPVKWS